MRVVSAGVDARWYMACRALRLGSAWIYLTPAGVDSLGGWDPRVGPSAQPGARLVQTLPGLDEAAGRPYSAIH